MTINLDQYTNTLSVTDTATNADLTVVSRGTGVVNLNTGNGTAVRIADFSATTTSGLGIFAGSSGQNSLYMTPYGSGAGSNLILMSKGTGNLFLGTNSNNSSNLNIQANISHTASAVNYVQVTGAATGASPTITSQGSDTNINLSLSPKGAAVVAVSSELRVATAAVNFFQMYGSGSGSGPVFASIGSDTNIDLTLTPKGTGNVRFGTHTGTADTAVSGYIEIKDSGGTIRKLAVIT
jgi:hypothetical protein